jgi:hypothetical protein
MPIQSDADPYCVFCTAPPDRIIAANELAFALRDTSPPGKTNCVGNLYTCQYQVDASV